MDSNASSRGIYKKLIIGVATFDYRPWFTIGNGTVQNYSPLMSESLENWILYLRSRILCISFGKAGVLGSKFYEPWKWLELCVSNIPDRRPRCNGTYVMSVRLPIFFKRYRFRNRSRSRKTTVRRATDIIRNGLLSAQSIINSTSDVRLFL